MSYQKQYLPYLFGNKKNQNYKLPQDIAWGSLSFDATLMFKTLQNKLDEFLLEYEWERITYQDACHLYHYLEFIHDKELLIKIIFQFKDVFEFVRSQLECNHQANHQNIQELLDFNFNETVVFALLPLNRTRPGTLVIKKNDGTWSKDKSGSIWSLPVLGMSSRGLDYHYTNGQTPQGVYTVDGVMKKADRFLDFGKFRRLILNFIPKSDDEKMIKHLLPKSHWNLNWWREAVIARELGRSHLRIHGAGRKNLKIGTSYFPFVPTSGCLATREGHFGLFKFNDQKKILNQLIQALDLPNEESSEEKISAKLLVINTDINFSNLIFK
jgi:hypothetical protein